MSAELLRDVRNFTERMAEHPLQRAAQLHYGLPADNALATEWLTRPEWVHAEFEACLLVARALEPELVPRLVRRDRDALLAQLDASLAPWDALRQLGFAGDRDSYSELANSRIDQVLARRKGIPITLAVVLMEAARLQGLSAVGLNHPGHFLLRLENRLLDPFALQPLAETCLEQPVPVALPQAMLLRMLNNVKAVFQQQQRWDRALDLVSLQLAVLPEQPNLWCAKGDLWARIGSVEGATRAYCKALEGLRDDHPLARQERETLH